MARKKAKKTKTQARREVLGGLEKLDSRLVKALSHPVRARALAVFNERVASPNEIAKALDMHVGNVSYHVKVLDRLGCVELVRTAQRRGATEHYYRGVTRSFLNDTNWAELSPDAKNGVSVAGLKMINDAAKTALLAETFDARADRHLSCTPVVLDEEGWSETADLLANTLEEVMSIQARSAGRQVKAKGDSILATISILSFESPGGTEAQGD